MAATLSVAAVMVACAGDPAPPASVEIARLQSASSTEPAMTDAAHPFDAHAAATRSAAENREAYLPPLRRSREDGPSRERVEDTLMQKAGEAPDMADLDFFGKWRSCINTAKGNYKLPDDWQSRTNEELVGMEGKNGNIDLARCSFQPDPTWQSTPKNADGRPFVSAEQMSWGLRRYNLGDVTVTDCDFTDIPLEHGIYDGVAAHALYRGCTFRDLGGQAIQIAHRSKPKDQYPPGALPYTGKPSVFIENCHAVDIGRHARRRAFAWTFFDVGDYEHPGTIVLRDSTLVSAWDVALRTGSNEVAKEGAHRAIRSSKGLVATQYQHKGRGPNHYTLEAVVIDNSVFDMTKADGPIVSIRGAETILVNHSTFLARESRQPQFQVDDGADSNPSGTLIVQDCLSPEHGRGWLRVAGKPVEFEGAPLSLHCPGVRYEIDVATGKVERSAARDLGLLHLRSPLSDRAGNVPSGMTPQPEDAVMDLGTVDLSAN